MKNFIAALVVCLGLMVAGEARACNQIQAQVISAPVAVQTQVFTQQIVAVQAVPVITTVQAFPVQVFATPVIVENVRVHGHGHVANRRAAPRRHR